MYTSPLSVDNPEKVIFPEEVKPIKPVNVPVPIKLAPLAVKANVPPGDNCTSPVFTSPKVRVCLVVVAKNPAAVKNAPPAAPAETEAVGVPEFIFKTANFAEAVDVPPKAKSSLVLLA